MRSPTQYLVERYGQITKGHNEAQLICKTKYLLEEQIGQISGIQFFILCITGTTTTTQEFQSKPDGTI